ncbi:Copper transporter 1 [Sesamum angolense]|uniref:Copper transport protein n=1 Tax=Sesamum angolense TaxID=2727404 RepID=A0AAE2C4R3_9LAMI|nr:Copper transporter 1 [Sesamum angolense]
MHKKISITRYDLGYRKMEVRMTFFLGKGTESIGLYVVDLSTVFVLSLLVEWLSHTRFLSSYSDANDVRVGFVQTWLYGVRITMAYVVMLAVMSFNAGILFAAVAGYSVGFLVFGSRVFDKEEIRYQKPSDLPPLNC